MFGRIGPVSLARGCRRIVKFFGTRKRQADQPIFQPQRICRLAKTLRAPAGIGARRYLPNPQSESCDGFGAKPGERIGSWLLFCEPGIEQLLHGPGCLTKFSKTNHPRAALERMKRAAQGGLFTQVGRVSRQGRNGVHPVLEDLSRFFQKNIPDFSIVIVLFNRLLCTGD